MIIKIPMPINCVDCDNRGIRGVVDCKLIFSGCANCGRHPNCPLKDEEDCIDRKCVLDKIQRLIDAEQNNIDEHGDYMNYARERVNAYEAIQFFVENDCLCPSVTPQEPTTKKDLAVASECEVEDCISRKNILESLNGAFSSPDWNKALFRKIVLDSPTVYPKNDKPSGKWISVNERLPEPYMFVNATCRSLVDDREDWVVETIYLPIPKEHNPRHYSDWGNIPMLNWGDAEVIAWMERIIPEPYKMVK